MGQRLDLHQLLMSMCDNVYFQPPINVKMIYPCIRYQRDLARTHFADDSPYNVTKRYIVTVIDENPDSDIPDKVASLPMSVFSRFYISDNLNHDVYSVYF